MSLQKKLYIANGRWKDRQHIFVCGFNKSDAIFILSELWGSGHGMKYEFDKYFSKGSWGNVMDGIEMERGAWVTEGHFGTPKRVYPIGSETVINKEHFEVDPNSEIDWCNVCIHVSVAYQEFPCKECIHRVGGE
jgi:hypothetical protein